MSNADDWFYKIFFFVELNKKLPQLYEMKNVSKNRILFYRVMQSICHLNVTTAHVFLNIKGQEIDIRNCIPVIEDIVVLTVKPHSPEGKLTKIKILQKNLSKCL